MAPPATQPAGPAGGGFSIPCMRKWGAEHPVLLAAIVLTLTGVAIFGAKLALGDPVDDAAFSAFFWLIVLGLSWFFTAKRLRNTADRLAERGQVLAYIRYPNSRPGSLSGIWNMGVATLAPGRIEFQPAVYDTLEPSGRATSLTVLGAAPEMRRITRQEKKYVSHPGFQVITLTTESGDVEVAAGPGTIQKIRDLVVPARTND